MYSYRWLWDELTIQIILEVLNNDRNFDTDANLGKIDTTKWIYTLVYKWRISRLMEDHWNNKNHGKING